MTKHIDKETRSQMVCIAWAFAEMQGGRVGTQDLIELWATLGYPRVSWRAVRGIMNGPCHYSYDVKALLEGRLGCGMDY